MAKRDMGRRGSVASNATGRGKGRGMAGNTDGSKTGEWFRMGIASATLLAPLIARWNDLRLAERANQLGRDVGKIADQQGHEIAHIAAQRASELSEQARSLSEDLVKLASRGAEDLRHQAVSRLEGARQQFLETKAYDTLKGAIPVVAKLDNRKPRRNLTMLWVIGALVGLAAGGAAFVILRARLRGAASEPLVELPQGGNARAGSQASGQAAGRGPAATVSGALSGLRAAAERQGIQSMRDIDTAKDANAAPIVGNIHTMVYHDATDRNLPSEENRVYFASEAEARGQGYRPARPTAIEHNEEQTQSRP